MRIFEKTHQHERFLSLPLSTLGMIFHLHQVLFDLWVTCIARNSVIDIDRLLDVLMAGMMATDIKYVITLCTHGQ